MIINSNLKYIQKSLGNCRAAIFLGLISMPFLLEAQQKCSDFNGKTVSTITTDALMILLANIKPKGEFETQSEFDIRAKGELKLLNQENIIVSKSPEDLKYFEYVAEEQAFYVKSYAFDNTNFNLSGALANSDLKTLSPGVFNVDVVLDRQDETSRWYSAGNAMGATVNVEQIKRKTIVLYDRPEGGKVSLFPQAKKDPYVVGKFYMPPAAAQNSKPNFRIGFVFNIKPPYVINGVFKPYQATIRNPQDITENYSVIFTDIKCGLVLDENNLVLGAFPTVLSKK